MSEKFPLADLGSVAKRGKTKLERPVARKMPEFGDNPKYADLARVLTLAYSQAAHGKGQERHAGQEARAFSEQPINTIPQAKSFLVGLGGLSFQIEKKSGETDRMCERADEQSRLSAMDNRAEETIHAALKETLGVMVYAAAKYLHIERELKRVEANLYDSLEDEE